MSNTILLTPYDRGAATSTGRKLWRKQLLPLGSISYKGRKIEFTRDYLASLVRAHDDGAFDQVPFQLAPGDNSHSNDPERFRGQIERLELTPDGLDVLLTATDEGDELLRKNPQLGVSARIVEDYDRADGRFFPRAIQHVLGTLDPRITGMRPWRAVEAANTDEAQVIDLTSFNYEVIDLTANKYEETGMALTETQEARLEKLLGLPDDKFNALLAVNDAPADGDDTDGDELTDEELEQLLAGLTEKAEDTDGEAEGADDKELVTAGLSAEHQAQIDLANARAEENEIALSVMRRKLDAAAYEKERDTLAREFGIPPRITDLARPLLEGDGHSVELANGKSADGGEIVRGVFKEFSRMVRLLDLGEIGHAEGAELSNSEEKAAADRQALVKAMRQMSGI